MMSHRYIPGAAALLVVLTVINFALSRIRRPA